MNSEEKACQRELLDEVMQQVLNEDNPYTYSMLTTAKRYLDRFNLDSQVEPVDVLIEAYLRGLRATNQGTRIMSCRAWIKGAAHNIVREWSRQNQRERPTDPKSVTLEKLCEPENHCEDRCDRNFVILRQAFEQLRVTDPSFAELMDWRILDELSWSDIRQRLIERDGTAPTEEVLRQRASRAKRRLRRLFHELGGEYEPLCS